MFSYFNILALAASGTEKVTTSATTEGGPLSNAIDIMWTHITQIERLQALTFIAFGVVCLFYGWRVFKALAIISFACIGILVGYYISQRIGSEDNPLLSIILSIVFGIVAVPLMRYSVGILGAIAGAVATAGIWYAASLPEEYIWAGALAGFIFGGMISFIVFKISVMLFSSMGGAVLAVTGVFALLYQYEPTSAQIHDMFIGPKWFIPAVVIIPTFIGLYLQNKLVKSSPDWTV